MKFKRALIHGASASLAALVVSLWSGSLVAQEQYTKQFDEYTVHYNLLQSTFLTEEVAERYNIERDDDLAVLTVSVRAPNAQGEMTDQPSQVSGVARDLVRIYDLDFEEFRDPHAVYYIAQVPAGGRTELSFDLDIQPRDTRETYDLQFDELMPRNLENVVD